MTSTETQEANTESTKATKAAAKTALLDSPIPVGVIALPLDDFKTTQKLIGVILEAKGQLHAVVPVEKSGIAYFYYTGLPFGTATSLGFQPADV